MCKVPGAGRGSNPGGGLMLAALLNVNEKPAGLAPMSGGSTAGMLADPWVEAGEAAEATADCCSVFSLLEESTASLRADPWVEAAAEELVRSCFVFPLVEESTAGMLADSGAGVSAKPCDTHSCHD